MKELVKKAIEYWPFWVLPLIMIVCWIMGPYGLGVV